MIHTTAIISPNAKIGKNVKIGAFSVIDEHVEIKNNVEIMSHVCISGYTVIGENTRIFPFAVIGYQPQDLKFNGEKSVLIIGENNSIREHVTIHPGTATGLMKTVIGNNNLLMIGVHIAHDCEIANNVIMGNQATLGGHVKVENNVIIGGLSAVHQWTRIGRNAVIGGMSGVERDVIPFGAIKGERAHLYGLNLIGLKRADFSRDEISSLRNAYNIIFFGKNTLMNNLKKVEENINNTPSVNHLINFIKSESNRSFCIPKEHSK